MIFLGASFRDRYCNGRLDPGATGWFRAPFDGTIPPESSKPLRVDGKIPPEELAIGMA